LIDSNILKYSVLESLDVSRETFHDFEEFRSLILERNKTINLIGRSTIENSRERHIIDSAQIIDFIEQNETVCTDVGSGSGLPGIVLAIISKHKNLKMKFNLYEKSFKKSQFLNEAIKKFKLDAKVFQKNIFEEKNLVTDLVVARAFKPLPIVLEMVNNKFKKFKSIIMYLGRKDKSLIKECLTIWNFEHKEKKSITSDDSIIVKIWNLKKNDQK
tara:strand:+ start:218 stop:862 length:645 start_codon:yes stop_codon:yes gene_type:complete